MGLQGKNFLVTGAGRRVGRLMALQLASAGANIIIHYNRSSAQASQVKTEIEQLGAKAWLLPANLEDPAQASSLVPAAFQLALLDGIINSAAVFEPLTIQVTRLDAWQKTLQVNLTAPMLISQSYAELLPVDRLGRIVNILDWRALRPGTDHFPYTISKSALAAMTKSMAISYAPHILVNGLAFGAVLPPTDQSTSTSVLVNYPIPQYTGPQEIGQALSFLLDGPATLTGDILILDGGRHLI
jgi:pteridine reductase